MHEAAKLRPVVIDESLTDVETLLLAQEMGNTGAALKACKGQSQVLLMGAVAQKHKMFLCPGPDVHWSFSAPFSRSSRSRTGSDSSRSECTRVRPGREQAVGEAFSGRVPGPRRFYAYGEFKRSRVRRSSGRRAGGLLRRYELLTFNPMRIVRQGCRTSQSADITRPGVR